mmetsp:Transcript_29110/g.48858  ORF Transcript_29110/g.48858 Transcript_29110/m.48858 type:complete len:265 (-) Transcript_29110:571-1365(-)
MESASSGQSHASLQGNEKLVVDDWVRGGKCDAAGAGALSVKRRRVARDAQVALLAPLRPPRVLDNPVVHVSAGGVVSAVPNDQHSVVEVGSAERGVDDARRVKLEGELVRLDGDANGLLADGLQHGLLIAGGHVLEPGDRAHIPLLLCNLARLLGASVGVVPLRIQTTVGDDEVKGVVHESAVAAVVLRRVAVHQLLLGELQQFASLDRVDALGRARRREGPARAALSLILYTRHRATRAPVLESIFCDVHLDALMAELRFALP